MAFVNSKIKAGLFKAMSGGHKSDKSTSLESFPEAGEFKTEGFVAKGSDPSYVVVDEASKIDWSGYWSSKSTASHAERFRTPVDHLHLPKRDEPGFVKPIGHDPGRLTADELRPISASGETSSATELTHLSAELHSAEGKYSQEFERAIMQTAGMSREYIDPDQIERTMRDAKGKQDRLDRELDGLMTEMDVEEGFGQW